MTEPIELTELCSEEGLILFAKGWLDKEEFAAAVKAYDPNAVGEIRQCYGIWLVGQTEDGPGQLLYFKDKPGRGRFQLTYWTDDEAITTECAIEKAAEGLRG